MTLAKDGDVGISDKALAVKAALLQGKRLTTAATTPKPDNKVQTSKTTPAGVVQIPKPEGWDTWGNNDILDRIRKTDGGKSSPAKSPASLMGAAKLAKLYGITADRASIEDIYNDATTAQFGLQERQLDQATGQFYDQMFAGKEAAQDMIRKSNAAAVATGASRGMQAANELSAMMDNSKQNAAGATLQAQEKNLLGDKKNVAMMQNVVNALTASNSAGMGLAGIDMNKYAADTQYGVGQLDAAARNYAADQGLAGTQYAADKNLEGVGLSSAAQVKAAQVSASAYAKSGGYGAGTTALPPTVDAQAMTLMKKGTHDGYTQTRALLITNDWSAKEAESFITAYRAGLPSAAPKVGEVSNPTSTKAVDAVNSWYNSQRPVK